MPVQDNLFFGVKYIFCQALIMYSRISVFLQNQVIAFV